MKIIANNVRRSLISSLSALVALSTLLWATNSYAKNLQVEPSEFGMYIVNMVEVPIGHDPNMRAGLKSNKMAQMKSMHDQCLEKAGVSSANKIYSYTHALNGFSAVMSHEAAMRTVKMKNVSSVIPVRLLYSQLDNNAKYLGVTGPKSPRAQGYDGEGVVVGVIDSGIAPEHPSFEDDGSYSPPPATFTSTACDFGEGSDPEGQPFDFPFVCNNKLVSAEIFNDTAEAVYGDVPGIFDGSARDDGGHGTACASIAVGNENVPVVVNDHVRLDTISGIAPRAHLAFYKAGAGNTGSLFNSDILAAIDKAVDDGVDVLSLSFGGAPSASLDEYEISLLFAATGGTASVSSNGNSGPGAGTTGAPSRSPWVLAVAAGTQNRIFTGKLTLGNGKQLTGISVNAKSNKAPLIDGGDCTADELVGLDVQGKIVACDLINYQGGPSLDRPNSALREAKVAGAVFYQTEPTLGLTVDQKIEQGFGPQASEIPTIFLNSKSSQKLVQYLANSSHPQASFKKGGKKQSSQDSVVTFFSSRGPAIFVSDVIKPEITAPGIQTLTAISPFNRFGVVGDFMPNFGGTSAAAPHAAGVMAMVKQAHPDWSAAMIKSALMTTARQNVLKEDGVTPADPFDMGAGYLDLQANCEKKPHHRDGYQHGYKHHKGGNQCKKSDALKGTPIDPGLVYDAGFPDYLAFLCGTDFGLVGAATCQSIIDSGGSIDPSDLNLPSIGIAELAGSQTVIRSVTNVASDPTATSYHVKVKAPEGFKVNVSPAVLQIPVGETATYQVTIENASAAIGEWRFGSLTWHSKNAEAKHHHKSGQAAGYQVYSPIAVRASEFDAQFVNEGVGSDGTLNIPVKFGYNGSYQAVAHGLVAPQLQAGSVLNEPTPESNPFGDVDISELRTLVANGYAFEHTVVIPAGTVFARFATFDDYTAGDDDLDLFAYDGSDVKVGESGSFGSNERIDLFFPTPGTYKVFVHGYDTQGPDSAYTLFSWAVGPDVGNMTLTAPAAATLGETENVRVDWSGLTTSIDNSPYLGVVIHEKDGVPISASLIEIDVTP